MWTIETIKLAGYWPKDTDNVKNFIDDHIHYRTEIEFINKKTGNPKWWGNLNHPPVYEWDSDYEDFND